MADGSSALGLLSEGRRGRVERGKGLDPPPHSREGGPAAPTDPVPVPLAVLQALALPAPAAKGRSHSRVPQERTWKN